jgi:hypothetical protein
MTCTLLLLTSRATFGQVSPAEILNPKLKEVEQKYLPQLESLRHTIDETRFPFAFVLTRYVGADTEKPGMVDTRGLEFVIFQERMLLKVSGHYKAAFNAKELSQNQRADRTLQDVVVPIVKLVRQQFPGGVDCDGIGFEIAYHTRASKQGYEYEGMEMLVVVFSVPDAFAFVTVAGNESRQTIINRSQVFANGKEFALALGAHDPLDLDELGRTESAERAGPSAAAPVTGYSSPPPLVSPPAGPAVPSSSVHADRREQAPPAVAAVGSSADPAAASVQADAGRLQAKFQSQLDALTKDDSEKFHFVDYAPPSFGVYHDSVVLQVTLRNPLAFDKGATSIYKRAAQSLDLLLAPELKALVPKLPSDTAIFALDLSVLNRLGPEKDSSEAVEFICPLKSVDSFIRDEITSQDLVNQSIVLVNGVRIALNLQLVE